MNILLILQLDADQIKKIQNSIENTFGLKCHILNDVSTLSETLQNNYDIQAIIIQEILKNSDFEQIVINFSKEICIINIDNIFLENILKTIQTLVQQGIFDSSSNQSILYSKIKTDLLVKVVPLEVDVFIRLSKEKFLKIFSKGDSFTDEDLRKYLNQKNIHYFYLNNSDSSLFLKKTTALLEKSISSQNLDTPLLVDVHSTVQEMSKELGFTLELQDLVKASVKASLKTLKQIPKLSALLERLEKEKTDYLAAHSMITAHVACSLASFLSWSSETTAEKLTYASVFHDLSLSNAALARIDSIEELNKNLDNFTNKEIEIYKNHPIQAAEFALKFSEIPADVGMIIKEHHERPDGTGFPRKLSGSRVAPLSCIFIVAHDFVQSRLLRNESPSEFIERKKDLYSAGSFRKVLNAISKLD